MHFDSLGLPPQGFAQSRSRCWDRCIIYTICTSRPHILFSRRNLLFSKIEQVHVISLDPFDLKKTTTGGIIFCRGSRLVQGSKARDRRKSHEGKLITLGKLAPQWSPHARAEKIPIDWKRFPDFSQCNLYDATMSGIGKLLNIFLNLILTTRSKWNVLKYSIGKWASNVISVATTRIYNFHDISTGLCTIYWLQIRIINWKSRSIGSVVALMVFVRGMLNLAQATSDDLFLLKRVLSCMDSRDFG